MSSMSYFSSFSGAGRQFRLCSDHGLYGVLCSFNCVLSSPIIRDHPVYAWGKVWSMRNLTFPSLYSILFMLNSLVSIVKKDTGTLVLRKTTRAGWFFDYLNEYGTFLNADILLRDGVSIMSYKNGSIFCRGFQYNRNQIAHERIIYNSSV